MTPFYTVTESGEVDIKFRKVCPPGYTSEAPPAPPEPERVREIDIPFEEAEAFATLYPTIARYL